MILTGVVATVLGAATWSPGGLNGLSINKDAIAVYWVLTVAASVIGVMTLTGMVFSKSWLRLTGAGFACVVVGMSLELAVLPYVWPFGFDPGSYWAIGFIDLTQGAWLVGVIALVQAGGFRLKSYGNPPVKGAVAGKAG
jgi:hypothetical protein